MFRSLLHASSTSLNAVYVVLPPAPCGVAAACTAWEGENLVSQPANPSPQPHDSHATAMLQPHDSHTTAMLQPHYSHTTATLQTCYHTTAMLQPQQPHYSHATAILQPHYSHATATLQPCYSQQSVPLSIMTILPYISIYEKRPATMGHEYMTPLRAMTPLGHEYMAPLWAMVSHSHNIPYFGIAIAHPPFN